MEKIIGVYKITNTVTNDCYIGSSNNVKSRLAHHKITSTWGKYPNKQLYQDMQKYGTDNFAFEMLTEVEADKLKEVEQQIIEKMKPTYNDRNAKGLDVERYKEYNKEYQKEYQKEYRKQLCSYNGEVLTLHALVLRFRRAGIEHPTLEAKKYLLVK